MEARSCMICKSLGAGQRIRGSISGGSLSRAAEQILRKQSHGEQ